MLIRIQMMIGNTFFIITIMIETWNEMKCVRKCQNSLKFNNQEKDEIFRYNRELEKNNVLY